ncbi:MAG: hypothetical protein R3D02_08900 [Hyphomicrobiales bacterium]
MTGGDDNSGHSPIDAHCTKNRCCINPVVNATRFLRSLGCARLISRARAANRRGAQGEEKMTRTVDTAALAGANARPSAANSFSDAIDKAASRAGSAIRGGATAVLNGLIPAAQANSPADVMIERMMHPDAGVIAGTFNFNGVPMLAAALPPVGALTSGDLTGVVRNATYFVAMKDSNGKQYIFTGNADSGIYEVGVPNFATKAFNFGGLKGLVFSNSRTGVGRDGGGQITASVNSGILVSDLPPWAKNQIKQGMSLAVGNMMEKFVARHLEKAVDKSKPEPQVGRSWQSTILKNIIEYGAKEKVEKALIPSLARQVGQAAFDSFNRNVSLHWGVAYRDDVRINVHNGQLQTNGTHTTTFDLGKVGADVLSQILPK